MKTEVLKNNQPQEKPTKPMQERKKKKRQTNIIFSLIDSTTDSPGLFLFLKQVWVSNDT